MAVRHTLAIAMISFGTIAAPTPALAQAEEVTVRSCTVQSLGVFPDRIHILCNHNAPPPTSGLGALVTSPQKPTIVAPPYFALENGPMAAAALTAASAAMTKNRTLTIIYKNAASQNPGGCQTNDCRRLVAVMIN